MSGRGAELPSRRGAWILAAAFFLIAASWKSEGPYFGHVLSIAVDPANPDRVFVSTHGGGVWRSTDGGATWQLAGKELSDRVVPYVVMQPGTGVLWAGVESSTLARSKDGGDTWEWISNDLTDTPYRPVFAGKAILVPASNLHLRSADGAKWGDFRIGGGDVRTFAVHPSDPKTIWAGGANGRAGLWKSTDGGVSWKSMLAKGLPERNTAHRILVDPAQPDVLYMKTRRGGARSEDGGETWSEFGGAIADEEMESFTLTSSALFAGTSKGFYRSTDGGQSWTRIGGGLPRYIISALAVHPAKAEVMWAGASSAGLYKTTDGGKTWTEANRGFAAAWVDDVWSDASGKVFAKMSRGTFRLDGNGAWVAVDDVRRGEPVKAIDGFRVAEEGVERSTDGGKTWAPFNDGLTNVDVRALHRVGKRVYAATAGGGVFSVEVE